MPAPIDPLTPLTVEILRAELSLFAREELRKELTTLREGLLLDVRGGTRGSASTERRLSDPQALQSRPSYIVPQGFSLKKRKTSTAESLAPERTRASVAGRASMETAATTSPFLNFSAISGGLEDSLGIKLPASLTVPPIEEDATAQKGSDEARQLLLGDVAEIDLDAPQPQSLKGRLQSFLQDRLYTDVWCGVIILNAVWIGFQTDHQARHPHAYRVPYPLIEYLFCIFFSVDIAVRLYAYGRLFFIWFWNIFDFTMALLHFVDNFCLIAGNTKVDAVIGPFLMLRLLRVWRLISTVELFSPLRVLIVCIMRSVACLLWLIVLILGCTYCFGILVTQSVAQHLAGLSTEGREEQEILIEYFGSLQNSMVILYKAISEGIHWGEVSEPLAKFCSPWFNLIFGVYMSFVLFAVMNVLTANFIDAALDVANEEKRAHMSNSLWHRFAPGGHTHVAISRDRFEDCMETEEMQAYLDTLSIDGEQARACNLFGLIDEDGSGSIEPEELVSGCMRLSGVAKSFDLARLCREFFTHSNQVDDHIQKMDSHIERVDLHLSDLVERLSRKEDSHAERIEMHLSDLVERLSRKDAPEA